MSFTYSSMIRAVRDFACFCLPASFSAMIIFLLSAMHAEAASNGKTTVDFNSQIRPIISAKCFHCHGPDDSSRKAKLRLDIRDQAVKERDGKLPIKPGD